ncbi:hypothetical protein BVU76_02915 [Mycolicibacterium porcinum]|nr:hypothetical protein BVU76_02915 [Mycolicibacterium porcinum]
MTALSAHAPTFRAPWRHCTSRSAGSPRKGADLDDGALSYRLARIYADYNQIHPFREGNGRTGTLLLHLLAGRAGRRLHLDDMPRSEWIAASRDSMPFRRDGRADPRPFVAVLRGRLGAAKDSDRSDSAAPSARSRPPDHRCSPRPSVQS